jgi:transposase InsO family protein
MPDPVAPPAPDLIGQGFTATGPDQHWCGDITYLRLGDPFLYLATVIDIATRRLVDHHSPANQPGHRRPRRRGRRPRLGRVDGVIFYSDRGS